MLHLTQEQILLIVLGLMILAFILILWKIQHSSNNVDLYYLVLDTKTQQPSIHSVGQLIALVVSTWVIVYQTLHGQLTEWLFTGYMLVWAGAMMANKYLSKDDPCTPLPPQ